MRSRIRADAGSLRWLSPMGRTLRGFLGVGGAHPASGSRPFLSSGARHASLVPILKSEADPRRLRACVRWSGLLGLLAGLPLLLLGPVLAGGALLVHAHGEAGAHLHLVPAAQSERSAAHHSHHGAQLDHEHARPAAPESHSRPSPSRAPIEPPPAKPLLLLTFPGSAPLAVCATSSICEPGPLPAPCFVAEACARERARSPAPGATGPPGRARSAKQRSGIVAVRATSRAIRI